MRSKIAVLSLMAGVLWGQGITGGGSSTPTGAAFPANAQTSTYQVLAADFAVCKSIPVASGTFTVTLVASTSQPASGQCVIVVNYGSGTVTVARSGQNINGAASNVTLPPANLSVGLPNIAWSLVVSDGTNYFAYGSPFGAKLNCDTSGNCVAAASISVGNGGIIITGTSTPTLNMRSDTGLFWSSGINPNGPLDLSAGRDIAGVFGITNGTLGTTAANYRDLKLRHILASGTAPTIASGFGTTPTIAGADGAGRLTVGTGGTATTGVITFGTAFTTAPACVANNETTIALVQAVASTTTLTLNASAAFSAGALLTWHCIGY